MSQRPVYLAILLGSGLLWGLSQPLGKIAVSTGHGHFGLIFWSAVLGAGFMALALVTSGAAGGFRGLRPTRDRMVFALVVALVGTIIPGTTFYLAISHLPSGVMSINIATVPLIALPIAVALGQDRPGAARILGLLLGAAGVLAIVLPQGALPQGADPFWILVALVGPVCYAIEGNFVARFGMAGMSPVQALFLSSLTAAVLGGGLALATGQFIDPFRGWGAPEWAVVASSAINIVAYAAYVWLAASAGAVFAAQSSYIVTGSGMVWAMVILGERHSGWLWLALFLMLAGVALVQPREARALREAA